MKKTLIATSIATALGLIGAGYALADTTANGNSGGGAAANNDGTAVAVPIQDNVIPVNNDQNNLANDNSQAAQGDIYNVPIQDNVVPVNNDNNNLATDKGQAAQGDIKNVSLKDNIVPVGNDGNSLANDDGQAAQGDIKNIAVPIKDNFNDTAKDKSMADSNDSNMANGDGSVAGNANAISKGDNGIASHDNSGIIAQGDVNTGLQLKIGDVSLALTALNSEVSGNVDITAPVTGTTVTVTTGNNDLSGFDGATGVIQNAQNTGFESNIQQGVTVQPDMAF